LSSIEGEVGHFEWPPGDNAEGHQWQLDVGPELYLVPGAEAFVPSSAVGIDAPFQLRARAVRLDDLGAVTEVGSFSEWSDACAFVPEPAPLLLEGVAMVVLALITARRSRL
jgi:hypothetical protein